MATPMQSTSFNWPHVTDVVLLLQVARVSEHRGEFVSLETRTRDEGAAARHLQFMPNTPRILSQVFAEVSFDHDAKLPSDLDCFSLPLDLSLYSTLVIILHAAG